MKVMWNMEVRGGRRMKNRTFVVQGYFDQVAPPSEHGGMEIDQVNPDLRQPDFS